MILRKELLEIDRKLNILIWMNLVMIMSLVTASVFVIVYEMYWLIAIIVLVALVHLGVSYWLHVRLKKHTRLQ